jgi:hypothetical protein
MKGPPGQWGPFAYATAGTTTQVRVTQYWRPSTAYGEKDVGSGPLVFNPTGGARCSGQYQLALVSAALEGVRQILVEVSTAATGTLILAGASNATNSCVRFMVSSPSQADPQSTAQFIRSWGQRTTPSGAPSGAPSSPGPLARLLALRDLPHGWGADLSLKSALCLLSMPFPYRPSPCRCRQYVFVATACSGCRKVG